MNCKHGLGALEDKNRAEVKQAREFIVEPYKKKKPSLHLCHVQARVSLLLFSQLQVIVSILTGQDMSDTSLLFWETIV